MPTDMPSQMIWMNYKFFMPNDLAPGVKAPLISQARPYRVLQTFGPVRRAPNRTGHTGGATSSAGMAGGLTMYGRAGGELAIELRHHWCLHPIVPSCTLPSSHLQEKNKTLTYWTNPNWAFFLNQSLPIGHDTIIHHSR